MSPEFYSSLAKTASELAFWGALADAGRPVVEGEFFGVLDRRGEASKSLPKVILARGVTRRTLLAWATGGSSAGNRGRAFTLDGEAFLVFTNRPFEPDVGQVTLAWRKMKAAAARRRGAGEAVLRYRGTGALEAGARGVPASPWPDALDAPPWPQSAPRPRSASEPRYNMDGVVPRAGDPTLEDLPVERRNRYVQEVIERGRERAGGD